MLTPIPPRPGALIGRPAPEPAPPVGEPVRVCASVDLPDRGRAVVFDVQHFRVPARAFVLRYDGQVVAYLNRCAHVPTELDWLPGEFLDSRKEFIVCAVHGAAYAPQDGRCVGGACGRGRLLALQAHESDGAVYWQPTRDTRAAAPPHAPPAMPPAPGPLDRD